MEITMDFRIQPLSFSVRDLRNSANQAKTKKRGTGSSFSYHGW